MERPPVTIRALADAWGIPVESLLDLPIVINVTDAHRHYDKDAPSMNYSGARYFEPRPDDGYAGSLDLLAILTRHRLVKERTAK